MMDPIIANAFDPTSQYTGSLMYNLDMEAFNTFIAAQHDVSGSEPENYPRANETGAYGGYGPREPASPRATAAEEAPWSEEREARPVAHREDRSPQRDREARDHRTFPDPPSVDERADYAFQVSEGATTSGGAGGGEGPRRIPRRGRPVRGGDHHVTYDITASVDSLMHSLQAMTSGAANTGTQPQPTGGCGGACERKYVGALTVIANALHTLVAMVPDIKRIDHPQIRLLLNASRNEFVSICINEYQKQRSLGITNVYIDGTDRPMTVNLGIETDDRLKGVLQKMAQLWKYETTMWEKFATGARGGYDIHNLIDARSVRIQKPFEQVSQLIGYLIDNVNDLDMTGVERARLSDWFQLLKRYAAIDHKLLTNELVEGYILKEENRVLKERIDSLQLQISRLQNRTRPDRWS
ncbi:ORF66 [Silurid herpesvirus 1]|nr:ORF66 [Silurid herpesvirus 1]